MAWLAFDSYPLGLNLGLFAASAVLVWLAGVRVTRAADGIARATGVGQAVIGMLLLAGVTSLPEMAVTVTASLGGNANLAVNNLLGSIAMQVAVLAVADALIRREALTSVIPDPVVLLQLALNILLLSLFATAALIGDVAILGVGAWSVGLLAAYVGAIWLISVSQGRSTWRVARRHRPPATRGDAGMAAGEPERAPDADSGGRPSSPAPATQPPGSVPVDRPLPALVRQTVAAGSAILVAGFLLSKTGEAIAGQTGIGQSFGGFMLVASSTSLPELSTVFASVRLGRYVMAVSDIFGTNLFNIGLVFFVDLVYRGGPVLSDVGRFAVLAAILGIVVTTLFMIGLVERRDRTFLRMGVDSFGVLIAYAGGAFLLFQLR